MNQIQPLRVRFFTGALLGNAAHGSRVLSPYDLASWGPEMSLVNRRFLGCLGAIGLVLLGAGALVFLNRDTIFKNLTEAWDSSARKTETTLFRWGELMSMSAELKRRYGVEPDVTYDTSTSDRTLEIRFSNSQVPDHVTTEGYAREIAAFAIGTTKKFEQIDAVRVLFQNPPREGAVAATDGSGSFTFAVNDLKPSQPRAR
jgi:hypothetical protein